MRTLFATHCSIGSGTIAIVPAQAPPLFFSGEVKSPSGSRSNVIKPSGFKVKFSKFCGEMHFIHTLQTKDRWYRFQSLLQPLISVRIFPPSAIECAAECKLQSLSPFTLDTALSTLFAARAAGDS